MGIPPELSLQPDNNLIVGTFDKETHVFTCGEVKINNCAAGILASLLHFVNKHFGWGSKTYGLNTTAGDIYVPEEETKQIPLSRSAEIINSLGEQRPNKTINPGQILAIFLKTQSNKPSAPSI